MNPHDSLVAGPATPELTELTTWQALERAVSRWPGHEAVVSVHQSTRWTYRELRDRADAFAQGLHALGLRPGDRLGIWAPNCAEWTLTQFATARLGVILVNVNPAYRLTELDYALRKAGVRTLVAAERFKSGVYVEMIEELAPEVRSWADGVGRASALPDLRTVIKIGGPPRAGWLEFAAVATLGGGADRDAIAKLSGRLASRDAINVQFTSGTTGSPKGATLSHRNVLNNGMLVGERLGLRAGDRLCIPVPLYHCFGMVMGNLACLMHGATMVYPSAGFDGDAVLRTVQAERCTGLFGVPTMFIAELAHREFASFDLTSLRTGCMAGAPCPVEVMRQVIDRMHMCDVTIAYGMTETSPVSFQTQTDDALERRVSTIGRVHPHVECKVIDAEGRIVPRGTPGELCTRGYSVMLGYWEEAGRTDEAIDVDGWMHTGDLVVIDEQGYGNVVGRIKDMVIRGGENIYPREVEEFLYRHPAVQDVTVVGIPDARLGEEVCAWICLRPGELTTEGEIIEFCRGQIAHFKIPRYVRFVDEFPMTVSGKVQKYLIRQRMIEELRL